MAVQRADLVGFELPPAGVLLAPAAAALALSVALGMVAFEVDLPGYRFGWRQLASLAAAGALFAAFLPVLAGAFNGRWYMPRGGYDRTLRFGTEEAAAEGAFRVLWLGEAGVLPVGGWELPDTVGHGVYATTEGLPATPNLWTGPETATTRLLPDALATAGAGETSRLGQLLAPMGVRYVIVADQLAPAPFGGPNLPADPALDDLLAGQLDLEEVDVNSALRVYRNSAWIPLATELGTQADVEEPADLDPAAIGPPLRPEGVNSYAGPVAGDTAVHLGQAVSPQWQLEVGRPAGRAGGRLRLGQPVPDRGRRAGRDRLRGTRSPGGPRPGPGRGVAGRDGAGRASAVPRAGPRPAAGADVQHARGPGTGRPGGRGAGPRHGAGGRR